MIEYQEMDSIGRKVYEALKANRIYADVWFEDEILNVSIEWGDWKHEHLRANYIIKETISGIGGIEIAFNTEFMTETDGSDTYSAVHKYLLRKEH